MVCCYKLHCTCMLSRCAQLEEKQQSLSSMEAKLKEREATLTDTSKEKDTAISTLKEQVSGSEYWDSVRGWGAQGFPPPFEVDFLSLEFTCPIFPTLKN